MKHYQNAFGDAGEHLVMYHLNLLQIECALVKGNDSDIIAKIGGQWRTIQVKSSETDRHFSAGGPSASKGRAKPFTEYDVDAFAFCYLPDPYPYYVAMAAIKDSTTFSQSSFTRQGRDMSWDDLLLRWGLKERPAASFADTETPMAQSNIFELLAA